MRVTRFQPQPVCLRPFRVAACCLVACLAVCPDAGSLPEAAAGEPQPIIVRGRRLPVLPGRAARMAARGEIFAIVPPPAQAPIVIREQAPPVIIREQAATGGIREQMAASGIREQVREQVRDAVAAALQAAASPAAQAAAKAPAAVKPPAGAAAASPFDTQGVEPASVLVPQPPTPQPPTPQPAATLPPIELLPTP
jgi:hypothetical protein